MARSPLTLAASVTSALPRVGVVGVGALTEGAAGRFDSALAQLDDGRSVVVRAPAEPDAAAELAAEARALRALTPGVRGLLPFRAPELLGETGVGDARAVVVDFLPGYRVDPAHLPAGRGAATSLGAALAALHALPVSIVRAEGLPVRTPQQVRHDAALTVDRAEATGAVPRDLLSRWRRALDADELWRFESSVVLGGAGAASFLFEDIEGAPTVTGLLDWHGLQVGDPATDLQWLASAPHAADDVYAAYVAASGRAPDGRARERARLYAELEFARWLVHGVEQDRRDVIDDATGLLASLSATVAGQDLMADAALGVDDALALLDRMPDPTGPAVDTSMQTDAYEAADLALWIEDAAAETDPAPESTAAEAGEEASPSAPQTDAQERSPDDTSTAPITLPGPADAADDTADQAGTDAEDEPDRAARAAFQRWTSSSSDSTWSDRSTRSSDT
jgi:aminoglycoside phosphotransferase (APT) family kinase protein